MLIFAEGGKPENPEKNPRSKGENQQQTQLTYDSGSGNQTCATVVRGNDSHRYAIHASHKLQFINFWCLYLNLLIPTLVDLLDSFIFCFVLLFFFFLCVQELLQAKAEFKKHHHKLHDKQASPQKKSDAVFELNKLSTILYHYTGIAKVYSHDIVHVMITIMLITMYSIPLYVNVLKCTLWKGYCFICIRWLLPTMQSTIMSDD
jgi:hypothetical protein